jgi:hypothetical protein
MQKSIMHTATDTAENAVNTAEIATDATRSIANNLIQGNKGTFFSEVSFCYTKLVYYADI